MPKNFLKIIAGILACIMLCAQWLPDAARAQDALLPKSLNPAQVHVPASLGRVDETYTGTNGQTVLFIQDAHDSVQAQIHIAKLITLAVRHYGVKEVIEEGYQGKVPTDEFFKEIRRKHDRTNISYRLLDELRIGGAEFAHINRPRPFKLTGGENLNAYLKNLAAYRDSAETREAVDQDLNVLRIAFEKLAGTCFSTRAKDFLKLQKRFLSGDIQVLDYLSRLEKISGSDFVKKYPLLLEISELQKSEANQNVKLNPAQFWLELTSMESDLSGSLLKSGRERQIYKYLNGLELVDALNQIKMNAEQYAALRPTLERLETKSMAAFLARESKKPVLVSRLWQDLIHRAIRFYDLAKLRDETAVASVEALSGRKDPVTMLVFGGFHRAHILAELKELGFSYAVITPGISKISERHQKLYRERMLEALPVSTADSSQIRIANRAPSIFVESLVGRGDVRALIREYARQVFTAKTPGFGMVRTGRSEDRVQAFNQLMENFPQIVDFLNKPVRGETFEQIHLRLMDVMRGLFDDKKYFADDETERLAYLELGDRLRYAWKSFGYDSVGGLLSAHLGALNSEYSDAEIFMRNYEKLELLLDGKDADRLRALWARGVGLVMHLRAFGMHLEVVSDTASNRARIQRLGFHLQKRGVFKKQWAGFFDNEILVRTLRQMLDLMIAHETQLKAKTIHFPGKPDLTEWQVMLWGVAMMLDPYVHFPSAYYASYDSLGYFDLNFYALRQWRQFWLSRKIMKLNRMQKREFDSTAEVESLFNQINQPALVDWIARLQSEVKSRPAALQIFKEALRTDRDMSAIGFVSAVNDELRSRSMHGVFNSGNPELYYPAIIDPTMSKYSFLVPPTGVRASMAQFQNGEVYTARGVIQTLDSKKAYSEARSGGDVSIRSIFHKLHVFWTTAWFLIFMFADKYFLQLRDQTRALPGYHSFLDYITSFTLPLVQVNLWLILTLYLSIPKFAESYSQRQVQRMAQRVVNGIPLLFFVAEFVGPFVLPKGSQGSTLDLRDAAMVVAAWLTARWMHSTETPKQTNRSEARINPKKLAPALQMIKSLPTMSADQIQVLLYQTNGLFSASSPYLPKTWIHHLIQIQDEGKIKQKTQMLRRGSWFFMPVHEFIPFYETFRHQGGARVLYGFSSVLAEPQKAMEAADAFLNPAKEAFAAFLRKESNLRVIFFAPPPFHRPQAMESDAMHPSSLLAAEMMFRYQDEFKGKVVLDAGAGDGLLAQIALSFGAKKVVLIEEDPEMAKLARKLLSTGGWSEAKTIDSEGDFYIIPKSFPAVSWSEVETLRPSIILQNNGPEYIDAGMPAHLQFFEVAKNWKFVSHWFHSGFSYDSDFSGEKLKQHAAVELRIKDILERQGYQFDYLMADENQNENGKRARWYGFSTIRSLPAETTQHVDSAAQEFALDNQLLDHFSKHQIKSFQIQMPDGSITFEAGYAVDSVVGGQFLAGFFADPHRDQYKVLITPGNPMAVIRIPAAMRSEMRSLSKEQIIHALQLDESAAQTIYGGLTVIPWQPEGCTLESDEGFSVLFANDAPVAVVRRSGNKMEVASLQLPVANLQTLRDEEERKLRTWLLPWTQNPNFVTVFPLLTTRADDAYELSPDRYGFESLFYYEDMFWINNKYTANFLKSMSGQDRDFPGLFQSFHPRTGYDLGSGTGVLSFAALKLGNVKEIVSVDFRWRALLAIAMSAEMLGVRDKVRPVYADLTEEKDWERLVRNYGARDLVLGHLPAPVAAHNAEDHGNYREDGRIRSLFLNFATRLFSPNGQGIVLSDFAFESDILAKNFEALLLFTSESLPPLYRLINSNRSEMRGGKPLLFALMIAGTAFFTEACVQAIKKYSLPENTAGLVQVASKSDEKTALRALNQYRKKMPKVYWANVESVAHHASPQVLNRLIQLLINSHAYVPVSGLRQLNEGGADAELLAHLFSFQNYGFAKDFRFLFKNRDAGELNYFIEAAKRRGWDAWNFAFAELGLLPKYAGAVDHVPVELLLNEMRKSEHAGFDALFENVLSDRLAALAEKNELQLPDDWNETSLDDARTLLRSLFIRTENDALDFLRKKTNRSELREMTVAGPLTSRLWIDEKTESLMSQADVIKMKRILSLGRGALNVAEIANAGAVQFGTAGEDAPKRSILMPLSKSVKDGDEEWDALMLKAVLLDPSRGDSAQAMDPDLAFQPHRFFTMHDGKPNYFSTSERALGGLSFEKAKLEFDVHKRLEGSGILTAKAFGYGKFLNHHFEPKPGDRRELGYVLLLVKKDSTLGSVRELRLSAKMREPLLALHAQINVKKPWHRHARRAGVSLADAIKAQPLDKEDIEAIKKDIFSYARLIRKTHEVGFHGYPTLSNVAVWGEQFALRDLTDFIFWNDISAENKLGYAMRDFGTCMWMLDAFFRPTINRKMSLSELFTLNRHMIDVENELLRLHGAEFWEAFARGYFENTFDQAWDQLKEYSRGNAFDKAGEEIRGVLDRSRAVIDPQSSLIAKLISQELSSRRSEMRFGGQAQIIFKRTPLDDFAEALMVYPQNLLRSQNLFPLLDEYDAKHFEFIGVEGEGRWVSRDWKHKPLILGTWRDVSYGSLVSDAMMERHVVTRFRATDGRIVSVYAYDDHGYAVNYGYEAAARGELMQTGNRHLFIDDHIDEGDIDMSFYAASIRALEGLREGVITQDVERFPMGAFNTVLFESGFVAEREHYPLTRDWQLGWNQIPKGLAWINFDTDVTGVIKKDGQMVERRRDINKSDFMVEALMLQRLRDSGSVPAAIHFSTTFYENPESFPAQIDYGNVELVRFLMRVSPWILFDGARTVPPGSLKLVMKQTMKPHLQNTSWKQPYDSIQGQVAADSKRRSEMHWQDEIESPLTPAELFAAIERVKAEQHQDALRWGTKGPSQINLIRGPNGVPGVEKSRHDWHVFKTTVRGVNDFFEMALNQVTQNDSSPHKKVLIQWIKEQIARKKDGQPFVLVDWGAGQGVFLSELADIFEDEIKSGKLQLVAFGNTYSDEWEELIQKNVRVVFDTADHFSDYFKPGEIDLMMSYWGLGSSAMGQEELVRYLDDKIAPLLSDKAYLLTDVDSVQLQNGLDIPHFASFRLVSAPENSLMRRQALLQKRSEVREAEKVSSDLLENQITAPELRARMVAKGAWNHAEFKTVFSDIQDASLWRLPAGEFVDELQYSANRAVVPVVVFYLAFPLVAWILSPFAHVVKWEDPLQMYLFIAAAMVGLAGVASFGGVFRDYKVRKIYAKNARWYLNAMVQERSRSEMRLAVAEKITDRDFSGWKKIPQQALVDGMFQGEFSLKDFYVSMWIASRLEYGQKLEPAELHYVHAQANRSGYFYLTKSGESQKRELQTGHFYVDSLGRLVYLTQFDPFSALSDAEKPTADFSEADHEHVFQWFAENTNQALRAQVPAELETWIDSTLNANKVASQSRVSLMQSANAKNIFLDMANDYHTSFLTRESVSADAAVSAYMKSYMNEALVQLGFDLEWLGKLALGARIILKRKMNPNVYVASSVLGILSALKNAKSQPLAADRWLQSLDAALKLNPHLDAKVIADASVAAKGDLAKFNHSLGLNRSEMRDFNGALLLTSDFKARHEVVASGRSAVERFFRELKFKRMAIAGTTGVGKTTLSQVYRKQYGDKLALIESDWSLKSREERTQLLKRIKSGFEPESIISENWDQSQYAGWIRKIQAFEAGKAASSLLNVSGAYDRSSGKKERTLSVPLSKDGVVIAEGMTAVTQETKGFFDVKVFLDVSDDHILLNRAIAREGEKPEAKRQSPEFIRERFRYVDLQEDEEVRGLVPGSFDYVLDLSDYDNPVLYKVGGRSEIRGDQESVNWKRFFSLFAVYFVLNHSLFFLGVSAKFLIFILSPLAEEYLFRRVLYDQEMRPLYGSRDAIFYSALIFSGMHVIPHLIMHGIIATLAAFIVQFVTGYLLAIQYEVFGKLRSSVLGHVLYNTMLGVSGIYSWALGVTALVWSLGNLYFYRRYQSPEHLSALQEFSKSAAYPQWIRDLARSAYERGMQRRSEMRDEDWRFLGAFTNVFSVFNFDKNPDYLRWLVNQNYLDMGAGTASVADPLRRQGYQQAWVMDFEDFSNNDRSQYGLKQKFQEPWPFTDGFLRVIYSKWALGGEIHEINPEAWSEHLYDDYSNIAAEIKRTLAEDGMAYFVIGTDPNPLFKELLEEKGLIVTFRQERGIDNELEWFVTKKPLVEVVEKIRNEVYPQISAAPEHLTQQEEKRSEARNEGISIRSIFHPKHGYWTGWIAKIFFALDFASMQQRYATMRSPEYWQALGWIPDFTTPFFITNTMIAVILNYMSKHIGPQKTAFDVRLMLYLIPSLFLIAEFIGPHVIPLVAPWLHVGRTFSWEDVGAEIAAGVALWLLHSTRIPATMNRSETRILDYKKISGQELTDSDRQSRFSKFKLALVEHAVEFADQAGATRDVRKDVGAAKAFGFSPNHESKNFFVVFPFAEMEHERDNGYLALFNQDGEMVSEGLYSAAVLPTSRNKMLMLRFQILPEFRGRGYGREMVAALRKFTAALDPQMLVYFRLEENEKHNIRFRDSLKRIGFEDDSIEHLMILSRSEMRSIQQAEHGAIMGQHEALSHLKIRNLLFQISSSALHEGAHQKQLGKTVTNGDMVALFFEKVKKQTPALQENLKVMLLDLFVAENAAVMNVEDRPAQMLLRLAAQHLKQLDAATNLQRRSFLGGLFSFLVAGPSAVSGLIESFIRSSDHDIWLRYAAIAEDVFLDQGDLVFNAPYGFEYEKAKAEREARARLSDEMLKMVAPGLAQEFKVRLKKRPDVLRHLFWQATGGPSEKWAPRNFSPPPHYLRNSVSNARVVSLWDPWADDLEGAAWHVIHFVQDLTAEQLAKLSKTFFKGGADKSEFSRDVAAEAQRLQKEAEKLHEDAMAYLVAHADYFRHQIEDAHPESQRNETIEAEADAKIKKYVKAEARRKSFQDVRETIAFFSKPFDFGSLSPARRSEARIAQTDALKPKALSLDEAVAILEKVYLLDRGDVSRKQLAHAKDMAKVILKKSAIKKIMVVGIGSRWLADLLWLMGKEVVLVTVDAPLNRAIRNLQETKKQDFQSLGVVRAPYQILDGEIGTLNLERNKLAPHSFDLVTMVDLIGGSPTGNPKKWLESTRHLLKTGTAYFLGDMREGQGGYSIAAQIHSVFPERENLTRGNALTGDYDPYGENHFYEVQNRSEMRSTLLVTLENDPEWQGFEIGVAFSGSRLTRWPDLISGGGLTAAIFDLFTRNQNDYVKRLAQNLFGRTVDPLEIKNIELRQFQEGRFYVVFQGVVKLKNGEEKKFVLFGPTRRDGTAEMLKHDYELLAHLRKTAGDFVLQPFAFGQGRAIQRFNQDQSRYYLNPGDHHPDGDEEFNYFAAEWLPNALEMNDSHRGTSGFLIHGTGRQDFIHELHTLDNPKTNNSILRRVARHLTQTISYDPATDRLDALDEVALGAGDFMFEPLGAGDYRLRLITARKFARQITVEQWFDKMLSGKWFFLKDGHAYGFEPRIILDGIRDGLKIKFGNAEGEVIFRKWVARYKQALEKRNSETLKFRDVIAGRASRESLSTDYLEWLRENANREEQANSVFYDWEKANVRKFLERGSIIPKEYDSFFDLRMGIQKTVLAALHSFDQSEALDVAESSNGKADVLFFHGAETSMLTWKQFDTNNRNRVHVVLAGNGPDLTAIKTYLIQQGYSAENVQHVDSLAKIDLSVESKTPVHLVVYQNSQHSAWKDADWVELIESGRFSKRSFVGLDSQFVSSDFEGLSKMMETKLGMIPGFAVESARSEMRAPPQHQHFPAALKDWVFHQKDEAWRNLDSNRSEFALTNGEINFEIQPGVNYVFRPFFDSDAPVETAWIDEVWIDDSGLMNFILAKNKGKWTTQRHFIVSDEWQETSDRKLKARKILRIVADSNVRLIAGRLKETATVNPTGPKRIIGNYLGKAGLANVLGLTRGQITDELLRTVSRPRELMVRYRFGIGVKKLKREEIIDRLKKEGYEFQGPMSVSEGLEDAYAILSTGKLPDDYLSELLGIPTKQVAEVNWVRLDPLEIRLLDLFSGKHGNRLADWRMIHKQLKQDFDSYRDSQEPLATTVNRVIEKLTDKKGSWMPPSSKTRLNHVEIPADLRVTREELKLVNDAMQQSAVIPEKLTLLYKTWLHLAPRERRALLAIYGIGRDVVRVQDFADEENVTHAAATNWVADARAKLKGRETAMRQLRKWMRVPDTIKDDVLMQVLVENLSPQHRVFLDLEMGFDYPRAAHDVESMKLAMIESLKKGGREDWIPANPDANWISNLRETIYSILARRSLEYGWANYDILENQERVSVVSKRWTPDTLRSKFEVLPPEQRNRTGLKAHYGKEGETIYDGVRRYGGGQFHIGLGRLFNLKLDPEPLPVVRNAPVKLFDVLSLADERNFELWLKTGATREEWTEAVQVGHVISSKVQKLREAWLATKKSELFWFERYFGLRGMEPIDSVKNAAQVGGTDMKNAESALRNALANIRSELGLTAKKTGASADARSEMRATAPFRSTALQPGTTGTGELMQKLDFRSRVNAVNETATVWMDARELAAMTPAAWLDFEKTAVWKEKVKFVFYNTKLISGTDAGLRLTQFQNTIGFARVWLGEYEAETIPEIWTDAKHNLQFGLSGGPIAALSGKSMYHVKAGVEVSDGDLAMALLYVWTTGQSAKPVWLEVSKLSSSITVMMDTYWKNLVFAVAA